MDPAGRIANYAAVGAFLGAAYALATVREDELGIWLGRGTVAGGTFGFFIAVIEGVQWYVRWSIS